MFHHYAASYRHVTSIDAPEAEGFRKLLKDGGLPPDEAAAMVHDGELVARILDQFRLQDAKGHALVIKVYF